MVKEGLVEEVIEVKRFDDRKMKLQWCVEGIFFMSFSICSATG